MPNTVTPNNSAYGPGRNARAEPPTDQHPIVAGYRIGNEMGHGPLGKVYRADHVATGEKVVFRGFTCPEGADPAEWAKAKEQFCELLEQQKRLDKNPIIQDIIGFGDEAGLFWIATEYFEGRTLQQIMASTGSQSLPWCIEVMKQVAEAVDFAGERGLTHTDLTPYNILLVNHPESPNAIDVRVINFGLAHARPKFGSRYAAPEQQEEGFEGDRRSDVYAVGALLFELITGKPIYTGATPEDIAQKVQTENPMAGLSGRPAYIQAVIGAMLTKAPRFRYSNVRDAIDDLANKRSPGDLGEANTDDPLADRKSEPKRSDTLPDTQDRFKKTEVTASGAAAKPVTTQFSADRITMQNYRLSEMDLLEIKFKAERAKQRAANDRDITRARWLPVLRWGTLIGVVALLFLHGSTLPASYSEMHVVTLKGKVMRQPVTTGTKSPAVKLNDGDVIHAADLPEYVITSSNSAVTFTLPNGDALYIPANSGVEIRALGYAGGPIRHFLIWSGRAAVRAQAALRGKLDFQVLTGDGVTTTPSGEALFSVADGPSNGSRYVVVAARTGPVVADYDSADIKIDTGNMLAIRIPGGKPQTATLAGSTDKTLSSDEQQLALAPNPPSFMRALSLVEENIVMPVIEASQAVATMPAKMNDVKALSSATSSMDSLCKVMASTEGEGGGSPHNINLKTLSPMSLPDADRQRILSSFLDNKLVAYHPLSNGGYELLARANDAQHTWVRGKNGVTSTAGTGDSPAPAK